MSEISPTLRPLAQRLVAKSHRIMRRVKRLVFPKGFGLSARGDDFLPYDRDKIYHPNARIPVKGLTSKELSFFKKNGWVGSFPLLAPEGVRLAGEVYDRTSGGFASPRINGVENPDFFGKKPWRKSAHAYVPEFFDIASHPAIVNRIASILGPDLLAWSFSLKLYAPGNVHRWHVDAEHRRWKGVSVFLGLKNITPMSTLKVINGSQRLKQVPQEFPFNDDERVLAECRKHVRGAEIVPVRVEEGEFFIFDGPVWHGSKNLSFKTRAAAIIQYARPDQKIRVPLSWNEPIVWHPTPPACVLVKGKDRWKVNSLVDRPQRMG